MSHHLTARRLLAPLALICTLSFALSLSACSSEESEKATPSSLASGDTFTEGIKNPELPERPAAMDNYDEDGAKAAAEYFLRLSLYGVATDNWDDYNALSAPNCEFCNIYRDNNHGNWETVSIRTMPEMKVQSAFAQKLDETPEQWRVDTLVKVYPNKVIDKENATHRIDGETTALSFTLDTQKGWQVLSINSFNVEEYKKIYGKKE